MDYDIQLNGMRAVSDSTSRDNFEALKESLIKIQEILNDINDRLETLEAP